MERRGSTPVSGSSHRHSKSLGTLNGLNGSTGGLERQQTGGIGSGGGMGSVPMSPAGSRRSALSPNLGSAPMSPAGSLGFGREGEWSDIQARLILPLVPGSKI
jgi:hypothetical protein